MPSNPTSKSFGLRFYFSAAERSATKNICAIDFNSAHSNFLAPDLVEFFGIGIQKDMASN